MPRRTAVAELPSAFSGTWSMVTDGHRCSQPHCTAPAVAVCLHVMYSWNNRRRRQRRWWCAAHLAGIHRMVRNGMVWWRLGDESPLRDLTMPLPRRLP